MAGRLQPNKGVPQSPDGEEHFGDLYIVEKEVIYHHKHNCLISLFNERLWDFPHLVAQTVEWNE